MRIAVDLTPMQTEERFRGIGVYAAELTRALGGAGSPHEFLWVIYGDRPAPSLPPVGRALPIRHGVGKAGAVAAHQLRLPRALRRAGAEMLHCLGVPTNLSASGIPLSRPCRLVVTVHDLAPLVALEAALPTWYRRTYYRLMLEVVKRADGLVADSAHVKDAVVRRLGVTPNRVRVVWLAPQSGCRPPAEAAGARARAAFGLPERFVLAVGDLSGAKDFEGILETVRQVRLAGHDLALAVAGRKHPAAFPAAQAAVERAGLNGAVHFLDFLPAEALAALYTSAAAVLCLGRAEGFGLPPLEAMACGAPVIAVRAGSLPEVLGDAPLWVEPGRPLEAAAAVGRILKDEGLRGDCAARGRRRAAEFSWARTARETIEAYVEAGA